MKKTPTHVPENGFGKISQQRSTVAAESLPTASEIWLLLRKTYGPRLEGATLIAVLKNDKSCIVQTLTFPGMAE